MGPFFRQRHTTVPPLRATLPSAVFAPRTHLVSFDEKGSRLHHLNKEFSLTYPVDWMLQGVPHTHLERLAFHYHEFLEALPFDDGRQLILDWIDANPPYLPGYCLDRWNSYAISIRCVCWMQWLAQHRAALQQTDCQLIVASLVEQIRFLSHNLETDICGNHLIKNIRCLLWAGAFFDGVESQGWTRLAEKLLRWQLPIQFLKDGVHFELSPAYHCQVFGDLVECLAVATNGVRAELLEVLQRAAQPLVDLTHPDGCISLMSDGGLHMVYSPQECLSVFGSLGGAIPESRTFNGFRNSGYYVFRCPRNYLVVDCGPACDDILPAHGHADILAFEWDVDGLRFVVDAGVYQYEAGNERNLFRSVASHNTVQVGERDQVEFVGSFRAGRRAYGVCDSFSAKEEEFHLTGHHRGFATDSHCIVHHRRFDADLQQLRIHDTIDGSGGESVVSRLLLHNECRVSQLDQCKLEIHRGNTRVVMQSTAPMRVVEAHWSPDFGVLMKTLCVEIMVGRVPCQNECVLTIV